MDYKNAGVDIEAGYESVELMKKFVKGTMRPEVLGGLGGFSGAFSLKAIKDMEDPVLGLGDRLPVNLTGILRDVGENTAALSQICLVQRLRRAAVGHVRVLVNPRLVDMSERHIVETGIRQFLKADRNMCRIAAVCQQDMNPAVPGGTTAVIQGLADLLTVVAEAMNFGVDMLEVY